MELSSVYIPEQNFIPSAFDNVWKIKNNEKILVNIFENLSCSDVSKIACLDKKFNHLIDNSNKLFWSLYAHGVTQLNDKTPYLQWMVNDKEEMLRKGMKFISEISHNQNYVIQCNLINKPLTETINRTLTITKNNTIAETIKTIRKTPPFFTLIGYHLYNSERTIPLPWDNLSEGLLNENLYVPKNLKNFITLNLYSRSEFPINFNDMMFQFTDVARIGQWGAGKIVHYMPTELNELSNRFIEHIASEHLKEAALSFNECNNDIHYKLYYLGVKTITSLNNDQIKDCARSFINCLSPYQQEKFSELLPFFYHKLFSSEKVGVNTDNQTFTEPNSTPELSDILNSAAAKMRASRDLLWLEHLKKTGSK